MLAAPQTLAKTRPRHPPLGDIYLAASWPVVSAASIVPCNTADVFHAAEAWMPGPHCANNHALPALAGPVLTCVEGKYCHTAFFRGPKLPLACIQHRTTPRSLCMACAAWAWLAGWWCIDFRVAHIWWWSCSGDGGGGGWPCM